MRVLIKKVYYCDHCKRHGLSRAAMEKHERYCTLNPERVCRWVLMAYPPRSHGRTHTFRKGLPRWLRLRAPLTKADIDELRERVNECPACMLAALRQSGVEYHYDYTNGGLLFNYEDEVEEYRKAEREFWQEQEYREIQGSWL